MALNGLRFDFSGVDDPHLDRERYAGWPRGTKGQDTTPHLRVAVIHAPYQRVLDHFTEDGADLLLAGHTHGGQICIPGYGALVANCDIPTWRAKGLNNWESNGTYDAGQRLRRDRHLPLRPGPHRLPARGRAADADGTLTHRRSGFRHAQPPVGPGSPARAGYCKTQ